MQIDDCLYTIEVSVMSDDYNFQPWWNNFREYYIAEGYNMNETEFIDLALAEWKAVNDSEDPDSPYFYFKDYKDYVLFMLRWS